MKIKSLLLSVLALSAFVACQEKQTILTPSQVSQDPLILKVTDDGETKDAALTANCEWEVSAPSWVTVAPESGNGSTTLSIIVAANDGKERDGEVTIVAKDAKSSAKLLVYQAGKAEEPGPDDPPTPPTPEDPTVIKTAEQLLNFISEAPTLTAEEEYSLGADIDCGGAKISPIPSFAAILDGKGHKVYNFSVESTDAKSGLVLLNTGTIKNIVFGSSDGKTYDGKSSISAVEGAGGDFAVDIFRVRDQLAHKAQTLERCDILRGDARYAEARHFFFPDGNAKGDIGGEHQLAPRVVAFHVRRGIGFGVAQALGFAQIVGVFGFLFRHGAEDIIGRAVHDARDGGDAVAGGQAGQTMQPGNAAARRRGAAQGYAFFFGQTDQLVIAGADQLFVGGDKVFPGVHGCGHEFAGRVQAADQLHHGIDPFIVQDILKIRRLHAVQLGMRFQVEQRDIRRLFMFLRHGVERASDRSESQQADLHKNTPFVFFRKERKSLTIQ